MKNNNNILIISLLCWVSQARALTNDEKREQIEHRFDMVASFGEEFGLFHDPRESKTTELFQNPPNGIEIYEWRFRIYPESNNAIALRHMKDIYFVPDFSIFAPPLEQYLFNAFGDLNQLDNLIFDVGSFSKLANDPPVDYCFESVQP